MSGYCPDCGNVECVCDLPSDPEPNPQRFDRIGDCFFYRAEDVLCSLTIEKNATARVTKSEGGHIVIDIRSKDVFLPDDQMVLHLVRRPGRKGDTEA